MSLRSGPPSQALREAPLASSAPGSEPRPEPPRAEPAPQANEPRAAKKPRGKICPTCGARYPNDASFCGKDSTMLVLLN
jgi:hypothetical protein